MTKVNCTQAQAYLRYGKLPANILGLEVNQAALETHIDSCQDCFALFKDIEQLEAILSHNMHARWDPVRVPVHPDLKTMLTIKRQYSMSKNLLKLSSALVLVILTIFSIFTFGPKLVGIIPQKSIRVDQSSLLQFDDLPAGTTYYIPDDLVTPGQGELNNEQLRSNLGSESSKIIEESGRITGWLIYYQREDADESGPDLIYNHNFLFKTSDGARLWMEKAAELSLQSIQGGNWQEVPTSHIGDYSRAFKNVSEGYAGQKRVAYRVEFVYRNVVVRVSAVDLESKISLNLVENLAQLVLDKLMKASEINTIR